MAIAVAVALAGAAGALARYGLSTALARHGGSFPLGTFVVNVVGCALFGWLAAMAHRSGLEWSPEMRAAVLTGFLGAFTTFSTFSAESLALLREGRGGLAAAYVLGSVGLGLLAAWGGMRLGQG